MEQNITTFMLSCPPKTLKLLKTFRNIKNTNVKEI